MAASFSHSEFFFILWSYSPACLLNSFCIGLHSFLFSGSSHKQILDSLPHWTVGFYPIPCLALSMIPRLCLNPRSLFISLIHVASVSA